MMRGLVWTCMVLLVACKQSDAVSTECKATAQTLITALAAGKPKAERNAAHRAIARLCTEQRWAVATRECAQRAKTREGVHDCGFKHLTQTQQDKLDHEIASLDFAEEIDVMLRLSDRMCMCSDADCAQRIADKVTARTEERARERAEPFELSDEQAKRVTLIAQRISKCMQLATGGLAITSVEPATGSPLGGTHVRIRGEFGQSGRPTVWFGSREATLLAVGGSTELVVNAPGGSPGETVDVRVFMGGNAEGARRRAFKYETLRPMSPDD